MRLIISPLAKPETFAEFCDRNGLQPIAQERSKGSRLPRWYVSISGLEIAEDGMLTTTHGNGETPEEALEDYRKCLAGKRLVTKGWSADRKEYVTPNEWGEDA